MDIKTALHIILSQQHLSIEAMSSVMRSIMTGQATPAQIGGFLIGLRMKGETVDEITAAAQIMREFATKVTIDKPFLVDIVGTGGDGAQTFNISTTSSFIVAAAGGTIAKHGNRSVSSQCGSADVLEALGVKIDLTATQIARCINEVSIGFMFAPQHHNAMKYAIGPRREMGVRTIFNLLGPLTNPAQVPNQLIGVYAREWVEPVAQVCQRLNSQHVLVVHSEDGLDEISIAAPTFIAELNQGKITTYTITPEQFGLPRAALETIRVHSVAESVTLMHAILQNQESPAKNIVLLNAGTAIYAAGLASSIADGITQAQQVLANGAAYHKLHALIQLSQSFSVE